MIKTTLIAAAIVTTLAAFQPTAANAGSVNFYFGFSGQGHSSGWSYNHNGNRVGNHGHNNHYNNHSYHNQRYSCREVRRILRHQYGYRRIRALDCSGGRYTFHARRAGCAWRIKVSAHTGEVLRVRAL